MENSEHFYIVCGIPLILSALLAALLFLCKIPREEDLEELNEEEYSDAVSGPEKIFLKESCPICLNSKCSAVATGCGHLFCGMCYKRYSEEKNDSCPVCRQKVEMIYLHFTNEEKASEEDTVQEVAKFVRDYNRRNIYNNEDEEDWVLIDYNEPPYPFDIADLSYIYP